MSKLKEVLVVLCLVPFLSLGQNLSCEGMVQICPSVGYNYSSQSGIPAASVTNPTNDYGCLGSTPNPSWFYFEISSSGDIFMELSASSDIDFIIYGPFISLQTAQYSCGVMGSINAEVVDCSFSATNNETPSIPGAIAGQFYVMLVTNYANNNQNISITQSGGSGEASCNGVSYCNSSPGTFSVKKNGVSTINDVYLCENDILSITNNLDANGDPSYVLPNDTILAPIGDYDINSTDPISAQLMWLVYTQDPTDLSTSMTNQNPMVTPGFMGVGSIISTESLGGTLASTTDLMNSLGGCGTYWFAPVAGDDGVGGNGNLANGVNDNGALHWDKNANGCYLIGEAIKVNFACPIQATPNIVCGGVNGNSINVNLTGGNGNYDVINQGAGNVLNTPVSSFVGATITNLIDDSNWSINVVDQSGCEIIVNGIFSAPTIISTSQVSAATCPGITLGSASVVVGTSGAGPLSVNMNGVNIANPGPYIFNAVAGTIVTAIVTDNNGCTVDENITIGSQGHYISTTQVVTDELCFGGEDGTAIITAVGVDASGNPDGSSIANVTWTDPNGNIVLNGGGDPLVMSNMMSGTWIVEITDNVGCSVSLAIVVDAPQEIVLFASTIEDVTCFGGSDGSVTVDVIGGVGITASSYSWDVNNPVINSSAQTTSDCLEGMYKVYVTDVNGCSANLEIEVGQTSEIEISIVQSGLHIGCNGNETGSILIDGVGNAQGGFEYLWNLQSPYINPPVTSNFADSLGSGTYSVKIQDDLGCFKVFDVLLTENDLLYWSDIVLTPSVCRDELAVDVASGQVSANVSRAGNIGSSSFFYQWTEELTGNQAVFNQNTWSGRGPGYYSVVAIDEYGCELDTIVFLDSLNPIANFDANSAQFVSNYSGVAPVEVVFTNNSSNYAFANLPLPYGNDLAVDTSMTWMFDVGIGAYQTESILPINIVYNDVGVYDICLIVTENLNGCRDTSCVEINVGVLGLDYNCKNENCMNSFEVYPNPTIGGVSINYFINDGSSESVLKILDLNGRSVYIDKLVEMNNSIELSLSGIESGVYVVNITSAKGQAIFKKLIIQ